MRSDRVGAFLAEKTPRRAISLLAFVGLIVVFRKLALLMIFFVAFERGLNVGSGWVSKRLGWKKGRAVFGVLGAALAVIGGLIAVGAHSLSAMIAEARVTFPARLHALEQHPWVMAVREHFPDAGSVAEGASHYATEAFGVLAALGHAVAYALIGLILAVLYVLEEQQLDAWRGQLPPTSLFGILARWFSHLADAVAVTIQLQLIVAVCNTVVTLPLLFMLGIPDKAALMVLIFASGLVPVIGNVISGAVLSLMAYQSSGWGGVAVFLVLTFLLHKAEAYYLNPRLTSRHVRLPAFLLIISLICWETLLGFTGLFVSFPFLFVAGKIREELKSEDAAEVKSGT